MQAGKAVDRLKKREPFVPPDGLFQGGDKRTAGDPQPLSPSLRRHTQGKNQPPDEMTYGILQEDDSEGEVTLSLGRFVDVGAPTSARPPKKRAKAQVMCEDGRDVVRMEMYRPVQTVPRAYERDADADRSARLSNIVKVPSSMLTPEFGWDRDCVLLPCSIADLRSDCMSPDGGRGDADPRARRPAFSYGPLVKDDRQIGTAGVHFDSWNNNSYFNCMIPLFICIDQAITLPRGNEVTDQAREFFEIVVDLAKHKNRRLTSTLKVGHKHGCPRASSRLYHG